ncbi:MAG: hypothetical protein DVS81_08660 [Candidatus Accumulibacter meliphilus]|uniref:Uncharacterized protein n=1 Tax=Candidatus Accumulibacter meliphilus TaxID=2211374 RepID=A0A369XPU9_9PROT|nr:MAG: hypothetical protein DVS81_08660 [Candidatus Accumulibacter meliphilus]
MAAGLVIVAPLRQAAVDVILVGQRYSGARRDGGLEIWGGLATDSSLAFVAHQPGIDSEPKTIV